MSFQYLFDTMPELGKIFPSVGLFFHYFSVLYHNESHLAIRKRPSSVLLFEKISKVEEWNHGWVYLENPEELQCFREVRKVWRPLDKGNFTPTSPPHPTSEESETINFLDSYFTS